jgi:hypothetical protein
MTRAFRTSLTQLAQENPSPNAFPRDNMAEGGPTPNWSDDERV